MLFSCRIMGVLNGLFDLFVRYLRPRSLLVGVEECLSCALSDFLWMAEVGCAKVVSANVQVETVFSGAGRLSMKSHCLGPQLLSDSACTEC